jgi:hypothetical protein
MHRKHSIIIPAVLAALVAGCSGGDRTAGPSATAQAPVLAATVGSATTYTSAKWGGGGYVTGLIYHPTSYNVMYARTDVGGAYRWNGGGSWTPITDGIGFGAGEGTYHGVESIALDPTDDNKVYMVTGLTTHSWDGSVLINGRIYVSNDRGASWAHYDLPFPVGANEHSRAIGERLKVDPTNPSTMFYASRTAGLWKSTNSGQTWTQTGLSSKVLTGSEIMGLSTSPVGVEQIMFDNSNVGGGATTWNMYAFIAPDYVQKAGLTSTLYKSQNGGATWTPVSVPSNVSGYYVPHAVRTSDGNYYVAFNKNTGEGAGGPGYLYRFGGVSFGETWTQLATTTQGGYSGVSVYGNGSTARIALTVTSWNAGQPVVQLSDNGGATWREIADGMQHWGGGYRGWVDDVEIDPTNKDHILHVHGGGVWETWNASDTNPSWDAPVNNLEETATLALVTPPAGASYKFVNSAGDIGNWVQTDLATTPTRTPNSAWGNGDAADVLWSDPNYIVAAGIISGGSTVAYGSWSGDSGNTWSNFASLPAGASTNFADTVSIATTSRNNIVWAPASSIPSWTSNNGASWTQVSGLPTPNGGLNNAYRLVVDRQSPNKVYAFDGGGAWWNSTTGKVYQSTDGGHSFALVQGSVAANFAPNEFGVSTMVGNPNASGDLWVADGNTVYHSTNAGASWTKLSGFATVAANGSTGALQGASRIALGKAQAGSSYSAAVYVVGTRGGVWGIWHSDDGGATWARYNDDAHEYGGIGVIAGDWNTYGRIYFSGSGRGVIYTN